MPLDLFSGSWFGSSSAGGSSPDLIAGRLEGQCIIAPLLSSREPVLKDQIKVAASLARTNEAALYLTSPATASERTKLAVSARSTDPDESDLLDWAVTETERAAWSVDRGVLSTRRIVNNVSQTVSANDADTVVLPNVSASGSFAGKATGCIDRKVDCNSIIVNGRPGLDSAPSILLPISGGPHSGLATDVAAGLAADTGAWIDILHVIDADATEQQRDKAEEYVETASQRIDRPDTTSTWVLEADDPIDAIVEQSQYHPVTVIGAPTKGRLRRLVSGSTNKSIRSNARSVVLSARNNSGVTNPAQER